MLSSPFGQVASADRSVPALTVLAVSVLTVGLSRQADRVLPWVLYLPRRCRQVGRRVWCWQCWQCQHCWQVQGLTCSAPLTGGGACSHRIPHVAGWSGLDASGPRWGLRC